MSNIVKFTKTAGNKPASKTTLADKPKLSDGADIATVEQVKPPLKGLFIALGVHDNNFFCVISNKQNKLFKLNATTIHSPPQLKSIFGAKAVDEYCQAKGYIKSNGKTDYEKLGDEIIDTCHDEGDFDVDQQVRPKGVYETTPSCKGDFAIVNEGNGNIYSSPSMTPIPVFCDGFVYTDNGSLSFNSATKTAGAKELKALKSKLSTFFFEHEFEHLAVLGLALAVTHPALAPIRPIWTISAEAGSGKTSLLQCLQSLWSSDKTVLFTTEQNDAQLISTLKTLQPNAILFDECENESYRRNIFTKVAAIARASYNSRESDAVIRAFQSKHTSIKFQVTTVFSGIQLPQLDDATMSRCIPFKLQAPKTGLKRPAMATSLKALQEICPKISKLLAQKAETLIKNFKVASKFLTPKMTERNRDKYSVMCAGILFYHEVTKSGQSPARILDQCADFIEVLEARNAADTPDDLVLQVLRKAEISFSGKKMTLQDFCKQVAKIETAPALDAINSEVGTQGIKFQSVGLSLQVYVATSQIATWLHQAFGKAKISQPTWRPVLRRVALGKDKTSRFEGLEKPHKSVIVAVSLIINQV